MRIVSLCPSMTHTLHVIGLGAQVVGVTKYCIHPPEAQRQGEVVGGTKDPDIARIQKLRPDWVCVNKEENRREDWEALTKVGLKCFINHPVDVPSTTAMLRELGTVLGCAAAEQLALEIELTRQALMEKDETPSGVTWAYLIWRKPWMTVNRQTYIHGLFAEVAPGNVFARLEEAYPAISAQDLATANPDRIFLSSEPFPFKTKHCEELAKATGLPLERFRLVDGERLSWHGAMTQAGLHYARDLILGE